MTDISNVTLCDTLPSARTQCSWLRLWGKNTLTGKTISLLLVAEILKCAVRKDMSQSIHWITRDRMRSHENRPLRPEIRLVAWHRRGLLPNASYSFGYECAEKLERKRKQAKAKLTWIWARWKKLRLIGWQCLWKSVHSVLIVGGFYLFVRLLFVNNKFLSSVLRWEKISRRSRKGFGWKMFLVNLLRERLWEGGWIVERHWCCNSGKTDSEKTKGYFGSDDIGSHLESSLETFEFEKHVRHECSLNIVQAMFFGKMNVQWTLFINTGLSWTVRAEVS